MACKYHYKRKGIEPCAAWGQKRGTSRTYCVLTDLDPRTGEIRQAYTLLYRFDGFWSKFYEISKIIRFQKHIVEIKQLKFIPAYIEVNKGDTITFINNDYVDHDVTEEKTKKWSSSLMKKGSSWSMVAKEDADYYCTLHVIMKGKIRIKR